MKEERQSRDCKYNYIEEKNEKPSELSLIAKEIYQSCNNSEVDTFEHMDGTAVPLRKSIRETIEYFLKLIYPGYYSQEHLSQDNLQSYIGVWTSHLYDLLVQQIAKSIIHECLRYDLKCMDCQLKSRKLALDIIKEIPSLRVTLGMDVKAAYKGDPAAKSYDEIVFSYPGLLAISIYRIAHLFYLRDIPIIPRMMTEYAHNVTGIDIHPGANIGKYFFIDHGTGVVIGETCDIGDHVTLYQGVTLGALSFARDQNGDIVRGKKRHPTIKNHVIIYSGTTILGGDTVIGEGSIIGGNVWLVQSVKPNTTVSLEQHALIFKDQIKGSITKL